MLSNLEEYYDKKYTPVVRAELKHYLINNYGQARVTALFDMVKLKFSTKWGRPPDKAIFEETYIAHSDAIIHNAINRVAVYQKYLPPKQELIEESGYVTQEEAQELIKGVTEKIGKKMKMK